MERKVGQDDDRFLVKAAVNSRVAHLAEIGDATQVLRLRLQIPLRFVTKFGVDLILFVTSGSG